MPDLIDTSPKFLEPFTIRLCAYRELEETFPLLELHPGLTNSFILARKFIERNYIGDRLNIRKLLGDGISGPNCTTIKRGTYQLTIDLNLWDVAYKEFQEDLNFWFIRYFLDEVPTPLFAYLNEDTLHWFKFIEKNFKAIVYSIKCWQTTDILSTKVAVEIIKLPHRNLKLLLELFGVFRSLSCRSNDYTIDHINMIYVVRYYSSCLFERPSNIYVVGKDTKKYMIFFIYLLMFWNTIVAKIFNQKENEFKTNLKYKPTQENKSTQTVKEQFIIRHNNMSKMVEKTEFMRICMRYQKLNNIHARAQVFKMSGIYKSNKYKFRKVSKLKVKKKVRTFNKHLNLFEKRHLDSEVEMEHLTDIFTEDEIADLYEPYVTKWLVKYNQESQEIFR